MTTTETATVEVLSAEVRVLQVGRRQITQSVFRQLDLVDWDEIEPFGRIGEGRDLVVVVGRDTRTGALVRSCAQRYAGIAEKQATADAWAKLPLIVLAGLR